MTKEELMELVSMSEDTLDEYTKSMADEILIAQAVAEKENIQIDDAYWKKHTATSWTAIWRPTEPDM